MLRFFGQHLGKVPVRFQEVAGNVRLSLRRFKRRPKVDHPYVRVVQKVSFYRWKRGIFSWILHDRFELQVLQLRDIFKFKEVKFSLFYRRADVCSC